MFNLKQVLSSLDEQTESPLVLQPELGCPQIEMSVFLWSLVRLVCAVASVSCVNAYIGYEYPQYPECDLNSSLNLILK